MAQVFNIWDLGSELGTGSKNSIPSLCLGKFMVLRLVPPKGKTVRDGLVMTAAMLSYTDLDGQNEVKTIEVEESIGGYSVSLPKGRTGLMATKYRGPKSQYKFVNPQTKKFYQISNDKFTLEYAEEYLSKSIKDWDSLSQVEKDSNIDEYFENMYTFGMSQDFALDNTDSKIILPKPGMVTNFYRRYTPPASGEKYGNTIITKWSSKKYPEEANLPSLTGEFKEYDEAVALAIYAKLTERETTEKFDPTSFEVVHDEENE